MKKFIALFITCLITQLQMLAQETSITTVFSLQESDTIDIYANCDTCLTISYYDNKELPGTWDVMFSGNTEISAKVIQTDTIDGKIVKTILFTPKKEIFSSVHINEVYVSLVNYGVTNEEELIFGVETEEEREYYFTESKKTVFRIFPAPVAMTQIWLMDSLTDKTGYIFHGYIDDSQPNVTIDSLYSYNTHAVRIPIPKFSDDISEWKWNVNGLAQDTVSPFLYEFTEEDSDEDGKLCIFNINVENRLKYGKSVFFGQAKVKCLVYPKPEAGITTVVETYSGKTDGFKLFFNGGVKNMWSHFFTNSDGVIINDEDIENITKVVDEYSVFSYFAYVQNGSSRTGYYAGADSLYFVVWPEPQAIMTPQYDGDSLIFDSINAAYSLECYDGDTVDIAFLKHGGYQGNALGWTINIEDSVFDVTLSDNSYVRYPISIPNNAEKCDDGSYKFTLLVKIKNSYTGNYNSRTEMWYADSCYISVKAWPASGWDIDFTLQDKNQQRNMSSGVASIRNGNVLQMICDSVQAAYNTPKNTISYFWKTNSDIYVSSKDTTEGIISITDLGAMSTEQQNINLQVKTYKLNKSLWTTSTDVHKYITVYNKPHTPTSLLIKGNGTSSTLIAMSDVSDADMMLYDYYLVFGYLDKQGQLHEKAKHVDAKENVRFTTNFSSDEINDVDNKFFVYAQWCYNDGVTITSGKRYMDGVDEMWDGSDYSGNGGTIRLVRATEYADAIDVNNEENPIITTIYYTDGTKGNKLLKGINIVKMGNGDTKKILIK
ncbi:MAG: hypothetical protein K6E54_08015 [Bacteroidaceae bacterium]|nr:hypothetical protein [Bacteroidaceae bacterium]